MRIINVTGHSGSGKTTFIRHLIPELNKSGPTATIKHLGHHNFTLEPGKDTTLFYESGAHISAGIDAEKRVVICRNPDLVQILDDLCDRGMKYTVIEGFKTLELPSVVIGDLPAGHVLFRNPPRETIIDNLLVFPEYHTKTGLELDVLKQWGSEYSGITVDNAVILSVAAGVSIPDTKGLADGMVLSRIARETAEDLSGAGKSTTIGIALRPWWLFGGRKEVYISSAAPEYKTGSDMISRSIYRFRQRCEEQGIPLSVNGW